MTINDPKINYILWQAEIGLENCKSCFPCWRNTKEAHVAVDLHLTSDTFTF